MDAGRSERQRVAVLGGAGQLGAELVATLRVAHEVLAPVHEVLDIRDRKALAETLGQFRPDWVANTAAFHDVDRCQEEVERALEVNALGAHNVAVEAARVGARVLYVSTDYVFQGDKGTPYLETDAAEPVCVYGAAKLAGEALTRAACPDALIVRTAGLYGCHPCRGKAARNFIELMLDLGRRRGAVRVIDSEIVSPTYTVHLARLLRSAIEHRAEGVLHAAGGGSTSWLGLARAVFELSGDAVRVERAAPEEFPKKAPRPACSALATGRAGEVGLEPIPHWREGLAAYLSERKESR